MASMLPKSKGFAANKNAPDEEPKAQSEADAALAALPEDSVARTANDAALSFIDTLSGGLLPYMRNKVADWAGVKQRDTHELVREARQNSPVATTVADIGANVLPAAGISGGLAKGGAKLGMSLLAKPTIYGQAANQALTGLVHSGIDEGLRTATDPAHAFNPLRIGAETLTGGVAGATTGALRTLFSPKAAVRARAGDVDAPLPKTSADPTSTIPMQKITGPEALQATGRVGEAKATQDLLDSTMRRSRGVVPDTVAAREPALARGAEILGGRAQGAAEKAAMVPEELTKRLPGVESQVPSSWPIRTEIGATQGLPSGIKGAKDSGEAMLKTLDQMKKNLVLASPDELPALQRDIAVLSERLAREGKAPTQMAAKGAEEAAKTFDTWRRSLPVEGSEAARSKAGSVLDMVMPHLGRTGKMIAGAGRVAASVPELARTGAMPTLRPQAVAGILQDPEALTAALAPRSFLSETGAALLPQLTQNTPRVVGKSVFEGRGRGKDKRYRPG